MSKPSFSFRDILFLIALAGAVWALLFLSPPGNFRSLQNFWNVGHIVLFFLFCHALSIFVPGFRQRPLWAQALLCLGSTLIIGGGIELSQRYMPGRSASFFDLLADVTGAMLFLALQKTGRQKAEYFVKAVTALLLLTILTPVGLSFFDEVQGIRQFPILADFESPLEQDRFESRSEMRISDRFAFHGEHSLLFETTTDKYSGISLKHFPGDWSEYSTFSFAVFNPNESNVQLNVRIYDALHEQQKMQYSDMHKTFFSLHAGWNECSIPLSAVMQSPKSRRMDMQQIEAVDFFVVKEPRPLSLYLDQLLLR